MMNYIAEIESIARALKTAAYTDRFIKCFLIKTWRATVTTIATKICQEQVFIYDFSEL
jgi:hypothetical protein